MSKGEDIIANILRKSNIKFIREKTFDDLRGGKFRYDFYLPDFNTIIECDGEQHFKYVARFYRTESDFMKVKENDRQKNSYALAHNIKLYRIPYWDLHTLQTSDDLFQKKYLVKNRWHNDDIKKPN